MKEGNPLVSVWMITYNHEKYIAQAIEGVLMQKASFPIELIIGEDNSTDNTAVIIKEYAEKYPEIIRARFNSPNLGMIPNMIKTFEECTGKYIALCEGDDYWTDPLKLQKQVDFLEENEEYGMCYGRAIQKNAKNDKLPTLGENKCTLNDLLETNKIPTLTVLIKTNLVKSFFYNMKQWGTSDMLMGDLPLWIWTAYKSKIHYMNEIFGIRNVLEDSASHGSYSKRTLFIKNVLSIRLHFIETLNISTINIEKLYNEHYKTLLSLSFHYQRKIDFFNYYKKIGNKSIKDIIKHIIMKLSSTKIQIPT